MAPDPGASDQGKRTVACNFESLVPDETHKAAIRDAVQCTHRATILATELLNMHETHKYNLPQLVEYPLTDLCQNSDATCFVRWRRPANGRLRGDICREFEEIGYPLTTALFPNIASGQRT